MLRNALTPIVLVAVAILLYFTYTQAAYTQVQETQSEIAEFEQALDRSQQLLSLRDNLINEYNSFRQQDLDRLQKALPSNVDTVRLIIEIDEIASDNGMTLSDVSFSGNSNNQANQAGSAPEYDSIDLSFTVSAPYETFQTFLTDLQRNLRIMDVRNVSFSSNPEADFNDYTVSLRTYWLSQEN